MNFIAKKAFIAVTKANVLPIRLAQYYLNKDAFDKKESFPGIYELADIPYKKDQKKPRKYSPKKAAVGKGRAHLLDIESPTSLEGKHLKKLPVIVEVHGGAYVTNNKECNRPHAQYLAAQGYKVLNVNYTLQPEAEMQEELQDLSDVLTWVGENAKQYGFDTDNVFLTGDSSGGHLVLLYTALQEREDLQKMLGVSMPKVKTKATAASCPVGSFVAKDLVSTLFRNLAGRLYSDEWKLAFSYEGFADATYPEVCLVTTPTDPIAKVGTRKIHEHLNALGVSHEFGVFEGENRKLDHVFNVLHPEWAESIEANQFILDFFEGKKVN